MTITNKIQKLYNKLDFLQDNDRWVQYREVYKEITELEKLRDESYSNSHAAPTVFVDSFVILWKLKVLINFPTNKPPV